MEKLWIHGGAVLDYAENLSRGKDDWRASYLAQREHKMAQFEKMLSYCDVASCRMLALVKYFGDTADSQQLCGVCDFCNPGSTVAQSFRPADLQERENIAHILEFLKTSHGVATGRLHTQVFASGGLDRRGFEELLSAMARSGLVEVANASFEKDGKQIDFRKVRITSGGRKPGAAAAAKIPEEIESEPRPRKRKKGGKPVMAKRQRVPSSPRPEVALSPPRDTALMEAALKAWRLAEARKKGIPAFRVLTDRALQAIATKQPRTNTELLDLPGVGLAIVDKYGVQIFRILSSVSR
jgi:superfamily II DNA helicase RecQ